MTKSTSAYKDAEIESYTFMEFQQTKVNGDVREFVMEEIKIGASHDRKASPEIIRKEREFAAQNSFKIASVVKEHRGIIKQEQEDYRKQVSEAVDQNLKQVREAAHQEGLQKGFEEGKKMAYEEAINAFSEKLSDFEAMLAHVHEAQSTLIKNQKDDVYKMIKLLTKWILLREVKNDQYIKDLFEKLILELQTKSNLLVKVNADNFERMPEVLELVQKRLGKLTNVRIEIEPDMNNPGLIVESENGIVDGSLEAQFVNLDKLFSSVGIDPNGENA